MARKENSIHSSVALSGAMSNGTGAMKKKIRDIKRLLARDTLSSGMRIANERALKTLEMNLKEHVDMKYDKTIERKYHMVRFFEKKKALRRYKSAKKSLEELETSLNNSTTTNEDEAKELRKEAKKQRRVFQHATVDLAYVLNFPTNIKYISLYSVTVPDSTMNEKVKKGVVATNEKRESYKKLFSEQLKSNSLEISIEDGLKGFVKREKKVNNIGIDEINDTNNKDGEDKEEDDFFE